MLRYLLFLGALLLLPLCADSASLTWGSTGEGGSGTWDTVTPNWYDGTTAVTWPTTGGSAVFAGTPGTVNISGGSVYAENLEFRTAGYVLDGFFLQSSANGLTINTVADATSMGSIFSGSGANARTFTKTGEATLTLDSLSFFDEVNILAGEIRASSSSGVDAGAYYFAPASTARLTLGGYVGDTFTVGGLRGGDSANEIYPLDSTLSGMAGKRILSIASDGGSFAGTLRDNGTNVLEVTMESGGLQELTGTNTYTGSTTIRGGTLSFAERGTALNTALTVSSGALLLLDNTAQAQSNRISDTLPLTLSGTLSMRGNALAPVAEIAGDLAVRNFPLIQVVTDPAQPATLTFQSLAPRTATSGFPIFAGTNLGAAAGPGVASIGFVNVPELIGGSGTAGSVTLPILAAAFGGESGPESLVTYGSNGVRPLAESEYVHDSLTAGDSTNVSIATVLTLADDRAINALRLQGGEVWGGTLTVASGTILVLAGESRLAPATLNLGAAEGAIFAVGDLTIAGAIAGSNGLRKSGVGTLTLSNANSYTGTTSIVAGTLRVENPLALGGAAEGTTVAASSSLELAAGLAGGSEALSLSGNGTDGRGALRSLGGASSWAGNIAASGRIGVDAGSLTLSGTITGSIEKVGAGLLIVTGNTTSLGRTLISEGTLRSRANTDLIVGPMHIPPLGSAVTLQNGRLEIAPAGANKDVSLGLSRGFGFTYSGGSTLLLDRGQNSSLTVNVGSAPFGGSVSRSINGTLTIIPVSGDLGTVEKLKASSSSAFSQRYGLVTPTIVLQHSDAARSASFLAYNSTAGLMRAAPTAPAGSTLQTAGMMSYFRAETPQMLTQSASIYALQNQGQTIDLGANTLNVGGGLILNGGTITGGTLDFGTEGVIYTSLAGATLTSRIGESDPRAPFDGRSLTFFGPGVVTLSGDVFPEDQFTFFRSRSATVNSGTLKIDGRFGGSVFLEPQATLAGSGKVLEPVYGGTVSPGNGAGILTVAEVNGDVLFPTSSIPNPTSFAFEIGGPGLPDFDQPSQNGNDLLRLTSSTPFSSDLRPGNEISFFFQETADLQLESEFYGGFYTDRRSDFLAAFTEATFHLYRQDPAGDYSFGGQLYTVAEGLELAFSTVPFSADFGEGQINGQIMRIAVVPEPGSFLILLSASLTLVAFTRSRLA